MYRIGWILFGWIFLSRREAGLRPHGHQTENYMGARGHHCRACRRDSRSGAPNQANLLGGDMTWDKALIIVATWVIVILTVAPRTTETRRWLVVLKVGLASSGLITLWMVAEHYILRYQLDLLGL